MIDCQHENRLLQSRQTKKIGGREFLYLAESCAECGAVLWNDAAQDQLRSWLRENKERFVLQFSVPRSVEAGLQQILQRYPGTAESHFVRAVLAVFTSVVFGKKELSEQISSIRNTEGYRSMAADKERVKMKARINPSLLEVVETWATLLGMSVPKFVEECLTQVVAVAGTKGSHSGVWSAEIDRQLDLVMKAA
jgi:hypothetical protein